MKLDKKINKCNSNVRDGVGNVDRCASTAGDWQHVSCMQLRSGGRGNREYDWEGW